MLKQQIKLLKHSPNGIVGWGLGWFLMKWQGEKLYGHDGATIGQFAFLRILPRENIAIALLTNGGDAKGLYRSTVTELIHAIVKVNEPALPAAANRQPDLQLYAGTYENIQNRINLTVKKGSLYYKMIVKDSRESIIPANTKLTFLDKNTARLNSGNVVVDRAAALFSGYSDQARPAYLQIGYRQYRRVAGD